MKNQENKVEGLKTRMSVNITDDCWKKDFVAEVEFKESRINGYSFKDMPASFTDVYVITKVFSEKYEKYVGKKCFLWINNEAGNEALNSKRVATLWNMY